MLRYPRRQKIGISTNYTKGHEKKENTFFLRHNSRHSWTRLPFWVLSLCLVLYLPISSGTPSLAQEAGNAEEIVIVAEGMAALGEDPAATEEEAVWDAKRNAVEQAVGVFLRARSVGRDFTLEDEQITGRSDGFIRRWEKVADSRRIENAGRAADGKILKIKIKATIALLPIVRKLSDIRDVYDDLERPRLRVVMERDGESEAAHVAQRTLIEAMRKRGFEVADSGPAEMLLSARLTVVPTVKLGDKETPFGVGDTVAASRARLILQVISTASEEALLTVRTEGSGRSFQSNTEADVEAATEATERLLEESEGLFVQHLLVRWVRERQEGHTVAVRVSGLDARQRAALRSKIEGMRGFRRFTAEVDEKQRYTLRFLTRLDTRGVRRRLERLPVGFAGSLLVRNDRGPVILCSLEKQGRLRRMERIEP